MGLHGLRRGGEADRALAVFAGISVIPEIGGPLSDQPEAERDAEREGREEPSVFQLFAEVERGGGGGE